MRVAAIIFAGGRGTRMANTSGPKQFMEVKGKPILVYTLERFQENSRIDDICLVVGESHVEMARELAKKYQITKVRTVVKGGDSAHASIICGLEAASEAGLKDDDIVLIHDGVRPIIDDATIGKCISMTQRAGNAITSMAAYETPARSVDGDVVDEVLIRDEMYTLQAPQTFKFGKALEINRRAIEDGIVGTVVDQAQLNLHYGEELHLIEGIRGNAKITVPIDYLYFKFLVESGKYYRLIEGKNVF